MKKILLLSLVSMALFSCEKTYNCTCTYPSGDEENYTVTTEFWKDGEEECDAYESTTSGTVNGQNVTAGKTCEIN